MAPDGAGAEPGEGEVAPAGDGLAGRRERLFLELTDGLYQQASTVITAITISLALFVGVEWGRRPAGQLVAWLAASYAVVGARAVLVRAYFRQRRRPGGITAPLAWARRFAVVLGLAGALWGLAGVVFFDEHDPLGTACLIIFEGGVIATSLLAVSSYLPAFLAFTLPALPPLTMSCFLAASEPMYHATGAALIIFGAICILASRRLHLILLRSEELRLQNQDLAARLRREKERVEAALLAKAKFLAAASHDLRQPLHALNIFVELLDARLGGAQERAEERAFLGRIQASSRALGGLLAALLDISRIDSNTLRQRPTLFTLGSLFRQLESEFAELAARKGLALLVDDGGLAVESDRDLLGRVLRNLLANAIRYTPRGEVTLSASPASHASERGGQVAISVADTGIGIPADQREKVFEEFYQVGNVERDREKGLGLGLSIVRGLCGVLGHPVRLVCQPERASGTEIVVTVPMADPARAALRESAPGVAMDAASAPLAGRRVLVIDDERDIRAGMAELLRSWQCEPWCAASADEAIMILEASAPALPDAVICDFRLPDQVTGTGALDRLEARFGRRFPAVIVTGDTSPDRIREVKSSARPLLFKPVMPGKLRAALTAVIAARE